MTDATTYSLDEVPDSGLVDSGHRVELPSGVVRERLPGKGRFDLVSPIVMRKLAQLLERGAVKYASRNWEAGMPLSWFLDSAMRHLGQLQEGDESEDHAVAALWNLHGLVHTQEMIRRRVLPPWLDDLPDYSPVQPGVRPPWLPDKGSPVVDTTIRYSHGDGRVCERLERSDGKGKESAWVVSQTGGFTDFSTKPGAECGRLHHINGEEAGA